MTVPGNLSSPLLATAADTAAAGANITKSVRFNSADSAYLDKTFSSASDRRTWTWAGWVKRCKSGSTHCLFFAGTSNNTLTRIIFDSDGLNLQQYDSGSQVMRVKTDAVFRDPSAWYHIVAAVDTTQSTASDRVNLYVNGVLQTSLESETYPSQNLDTYASSNNKHSIGVEDAPGGAKSYFLDGYLADVYFIGGSQLDCTSFGSFNSNGVWQAAAYSGTFGTNGFHLFDFANESTVGHDSSGNNNDFTANNISTSTGTTLNPSVYGSFASGSLAGAFDGSTASGDRIGIRPNGSGVSFTAQTVSTKLRVYCGVESGQGTLYINKTIDTGEAPSRSSPSYVDVTSDLGTLPFTLTDVGFHDGGNGAGADIYAIEVDNTVLVNTSFTNDILRDVPVNGDASDDTGAGGELSSNYCVLNPLQCSSEITLSDGNLELSSSSSANRSKVVGTMGVSSGKWYYELTVGTEHRGAVGWVTDQTGTSLSAGVGNSTGDYALNFGGGKIKSDTQTDGYGSNWATGTVVGVRVDVDAGNIAFSIDGTDLGNAFTGETGKTFWPAVGDGSGVGTFDGTVNFGQRAFTHSAPSNYKALCTSNLPTPTVADGSAHFESKLYTGNGSTNALTMSNSSMSPDWVYIHARSTTGDHEMFDIIRGANQVLESNSTNASSSVSNTLTSFDSNGFTLGSSSLVNDNNVTYVAYAWDGGSSNATNTSGSVNSTVRANIAAGFSIVKWTGTGSAETVGHGLGAKPHLIISHKISGSGQWPTYNAEIGATKYMYFNSTIEARTYQHFWNNTEPTSSVFSIGTDTDVSHSGNTHIAYCFAPVSGYQAMGHYDGTGSSPGAFVYTGFKPALVMIKRITVGESWVFYDTSRDTHNPTVTRAWADLNYGDSTNTSHFIDIHSNGFTVRSGGGLLGASGSEYFYWAIAENPFQANGGLAR